MSQIPSIRTERLSIAYMNFLRSLQDDTRATLSSVLPSGTHVALLDFPRHQNAGDSFIWLGTLAYLKTLGVTVSYAADVFCFDEADLRRKLPNGPILITGGGNFGDRWREHQAFREELISTFPDRQIIQLPQSLDFETSEGLDQACRLINGHKNLTLMFRQTKDMERSADWFPSATRIYCPDLALGMGELTRPKAATLDVLLLLRDDSESVTDRRLDSFKELNYKVTDWNLRQLDQALWLAYRMPENVARVLTPTRRALLNTIKWTYEQAARLNLRAAQRTVSQGQVLVTDRLHGMFLGALMGMPTIALDNANGKVSGIYSDYMNDFPNVHMVDSLEQAAEIASTFVYSGQHHR